MKNDHFTPLLQVEAGQHEKYDYSSISEKSESTTREMGNFPEASFSRVKTTGSRRLPQCIAHRGYKAEYPENTMAAFKAAIDQGKAHAVETDIHLTKDDVVVLSHDPDLKRCFGRTERIIDCDWHFLSQLRTTRAPHEPMPRLQDLLGYISQSQLQDKWILLDIKLDNDADNVMRLIAKTLNSVDSGINPWQKRVVLGIWAAKYLSLCVKYLPDYPIAYIGFSTCYARQFLKVPNVGFNMYAKALYGPIGKRFINDVQKADRPLYLWTVNDTNAMKWSIVQGVDGVITDDPRLYNNVCDDFDIEKDGSKIRIPTKEVLYTFWLYFLMMLFSIPLKHRLAGSADSFLKTERQRLKIKATVALGA